MKIGIEDLGTDNGTLMALGAFDSWCRSDQADFQMFSRSATGEAMGVGAMTLIMGLAGMTDNPTGYLSWLPTLEYRSNPFSASTRARKTLLAPFEDLACGCEKHRDADNDGSFSVHVVVPTTFSDRALIEASMQCIYMAITELVFAELENEGRPPTTPNIAKGRNELIRNLRTQILADAARH